MIKTIVKTVFHRNGILFISRFSSHSCYGSTKTPTIWRRFQGKKPTEDGKIPNFRIENITENLTEDAIAFLSNNMFSREPMMRSMNFEEDSESINEFQNLWRTMVKNGLSLISLSENEKPEIAAVNILDIVHEDSKDNHKMQFRGKTMKTFMEILECVENSVDVFKLYNVKEYITGMGLAVNPKYSGQGVGAEMLKARLDMCRHMGLHLTVTMFSNAKSQIQAQRAGFTEISRMSLEDICSNRKIIRSVTSDQDLSLMAARF